MCIRDRAFLIAWAARWAAWRIGLHRAARKQQIAAAKAQRAGGAASASATAIAYPVKHLRLKRFYAWLVSDPIAPVVAALVVYFGVFAISWTASMVMRCV